MKKGHLLVDGDGKAELGVGLATGRGLLVPEVA